MENLYTLISKNSHLTPWLLFGGTLLLLVSGLSVILSQCAWAAPVLVAISANTSLSRKRKVCYVVMVGACALLRALETGSSHLLRHPTATGQWPLHLTRFMKLRVPVEHLEKT